MERVAADASGRKGLADLVSVKREAVVLRDLESVQQAINPAADLANNPALIPRNCMAVPCLSVEGSLEGVVIAYNGKHSSGGFGKREEVALVAMGRELAAALALCQHETAKQREFARMEAQVTKWQVRVQVFALALALARKCGVQGAGFRVQGLGFRV